MAFILNGTTIRRPKSIEVSNSTQVAENRTLSGSIRRDYFGSNKRVWKLQYDTLNTTDFSVLDTIYQSYLTTGSTKTWQITETNYTVSQTNVHVDIQVRNFNVPGSSYLSNITLILTES